MCGARARRRPNPMEAWLAQHADDTSAQGARAASRKAAAIDGGQRCGMLPRLMGGRSRQLRPLQ